MKINHSSALAPAIPLFWNGPLGYGASPTVGTGTLNLTPLIPFGDQRLGNVAYWASLGR